MRVGTIELRSGKWDWSLQETALGSKVVYRLWHKADNEMVAWAPTRDLTPEAARKIALDPLHRIWLDEVNMEWTITLEPVRPWRMPGAELTPMEEQEMSALIFARGWYKLAALVPSDTHLGDLTHAELARLLGEGVTWR